MPKASDVQSAIAECVDAGLKELGHNVKKVIYFQLEKNFGIRREDIPNQPEAFSQALHSIFSEGAKVIERLIVRKIQEKINLHLEPETSFVDAVQAVKKGCKQPVDTKVHNV